MDGPGDVAATFNVYCGDGVAPSAWGWGCKGHQVVALIAEAHLTTHAQAMVAEILDAGPISADLRRYCDKSGLDAMADSCHLGR